MFPASTGRRRFRRKALVGAAAAMLLALSLAAAGYQSSSTAKADSVPQCSDPITTSPTGPATVSTATTAAYGKVLVVGSGDHAGCSLYLLTSDQLHTLAGSNFACGDAPNPIGPTAYCDTFLWPALLTDGAPIAGSGVNQKLLGTVSRTDLPGLPVVQQVTYAGQPLYRFFLDEKVGETEGANLFDPVTSPTGTWYLVNTHGTPATGQAQLQFETATVGGTGATSTVLAAVMNQNFSLFPDASFPVYTRSSQHESDDDEDPGEAGVCAALCEQYWLPVLTSDRPKLGTGVDSHAIGTIMRRDGTRQVTYRGQPLYLSAADAYISILPYNLGMAAIDGAGANTLWGTFNTIPPAN